MPPDYRAYEVLKRYPLALARTAIFEVVAANRKKSQTVLQAGWTDAAPAVPTLP
ncbi:hypothetical protein [Nonomuraea helvata]|uniref:Uncharacterized protein n=1 Tax=Nonomuraea helvata TaxID=37484 RepID=A0ABV5S8V7_9ACTN